jgi:hypothetical protein
MCIALKVKWYENPTISNGTGQMCKSKASAHSLAKRSGRVAIRCVLAITNAAAKKCGNDRAICRLRFCSTSATALGVSVPLGDIYGRK